MSVFPIGVSPYGLERVPTQSPAASLPWGQITTNKVHFPAHAATGSLSTLLLESNSTPYFFDRSIISSNIDLVNSQWLLPSYFNAYFAGFSGSALSNRKNALLVFVNGQKMVISDNSSAYQQGMFVLNSVSNASVPALQFNSISMFSNANLHIIPIEGCFQDFNSAFVTHISGSSVNTNNIANLTTLNMPAWASYSSLSQQGDSCLLFANGFCLTNNKDFSWTGPMQITFAPKLYGSLTPQSINLLEIYFLKPRKRPRHLYQTVSNASVAELSDYIQNVRFTGML